MAAHAVTRSDPQVERRRAAVAGTVGVAVALASVEVVAGMTTAIPSAVDAVSQQVVPRVPVGLTRWAIAAFGTSNVAVLNAGTTVLALGVGALAGLLARTRWAWTVALFAAFALLGLGAMTADPATSRPLAVATLGVAVVAGLLTTRGLLRLAATDTAPVPMPARRRFLVMVTGILTATALAAAGSRFVLARRLATVDVDGVRLPAPRRALPAVAAAASLDVEGLDPIITPNDRFFVIDTAVFVPQIDPTTWSLRIHGLVERELTLTYDELLALPLVEVDVTLACVSNLVGGRLIGNARWLGVRLDGLLDHVGVRPEGVQLVGRSTDGFTVGFPTALARDGRDAIVAVAMNGEPLPTRHGFPARLVVPGLYGYVSATKWLSEIELATDDFDAYWVPRGWSKQGPIKTQSRIDVPRSGASVPAGRTAVAGVAWAPTRRVARVEVQVDDGDWLPTRLSSPLSDDTWVQWVAEVDLAPGRHQVRVRATDGSGQTQGEAQVPPAPDGAEGWHRVGFEAVAVAEGDGPTAARAVGAVVGAG